ncbi:DUF4252 domain-containing protein [Alistipes sp.]|uniref:DUF4252 domain-containing protein n=1 Tax=Alistipes sp. TaxID=1872444 RepID=UPI0025BCEC78|nr:DUF4252 domain-containing protein [Alistipes sp.]
MKRIFIFLLAAMVFIPYLGRAQSASWVFFDRYSKTKGYASVQLERKMMRMMSRQAAEKGDEQLAKLLNGIQYIRIVALKEGDRTRLLEDVEVLTTNPLYEFQLVMSEVDSGQTTRFYLRESPHSYNSELLMLTYGEKETVVVNIYGTFDLQQVARLSTIRPKH